MSKLLIPVASYLRNSSDQQIGSIEQEREALARFAEQQGYTIVHEYIDEGLSGTSKNRPGWLRLLADTADKDREWQVVVMWDVARLGRVHVLTASRWKDTLHEHKVKIHTIKEGVLDWDSLPGQISDLLHAAGARQYSESLGLNSIRGRLASLARGEWPNGAVPMGFDREYHSPDGLVHRVGRRDAFVKPRGWTRRLVINEADAAVIRSLFDGFVNRDQSLRGLAADLSRRGVASPSGMAGRVWTHDRIRQIIKAQVYKGVAHIGGGVEGCLSSGGAINRTGYHEVAGALPAIVSEELWEAAQVKLAKQKETGIRVHSGKSGALTGLVVCGHCGRRLTKTTHRTKRDKTAPRPTRYVCVSGIKRPGLGCKQWGVDEKDLMPLVLTKLVEAADRAMLESTRPKAPESARETDRAKLRRQLEGIRRKYEQGQARYLTAPEELRADLEKVLKGWRAEVDDLERRVANLSTGTGELTRLAEWWTRVKGDLTEVGHPSLQSGGVIHNPVGSRAKAVAPVLADPDRLRSLLKDLGVRITIYWKPEQRGKMTVSVVDSGRCEAVLMPQTLEGRSGTLRR